MKYLCGWTHRNTFQWNLNQNTVWRFSPRKCISECFCKMAAILFQPQFVKYNYWCNSCLFCCFLKEFCIDYDDIMSFVLYSMSYRKVVKPSCLHPDFDNGLVPTRRQAIILTNDGLVYWCIYASLSLNELRWWLDACIPHIDHINGLLQERCNSIANALELCLSCTKP